MSSGIYRKIRKKKKRKPLQKVIADFLIEEDEGGDELKREISIDPNDVVACEIPLDEAHLGIGAAIGLGSMMHHACCGGSKE